MPLKRWPTDAVMAVCPTPKDAVPEEMIEPTPQVCRDCGRALLCCSLTMDNALYFAAGKRPVKFFCVPCYRNHDLRTVQITDSPEQIKADIASQITRSN